MSSLKEAWRGIIDLFFPPVDPPKKKDRYISREELKLALERAIVSLDMELEDKNYISVNKELEIKGAKRAFKELHDRIA